MQATGAWLPSLDLRRSSDCCGTPCQATSWERKNRNRQIDDVGKARYAKKTMMHLVIRKGAASTGIECMKGRKKRNARPLSSRAFQLAVQVFEAPKPMNESGSTITMHRIRISEAFGLLQSRITLELAPGPTVTRPSLLRGFVTCAEITAGGRRSILNAHYRRSVVWSTALHKWPTHDANSYCYGS